MSTFRFPEGKRFAFTVIDDTDVATVANVRPLYDLLHRLGMRSTKTVWPLACPEGSRDFGRSETLEDPEYLSFVLELRDRGFEITWHGPTMESSPRPRIEMGLERFREHFGHYPRLQINHASNRDNMYWGEARVDDPLLRVMLRRFSREHYRYECGGHVEGSEQWWGDLCSRHIEYGRNLTCLGINTARFNPSMPYRDPERPLVKWWFSATDAEGVAEFNALLEPGNVDRLEREGGFCIVATHFGKEFVREGQVHPVTRARLEALAQRPGWFPTAGELLDWLRSQRGAERLPAREWRRMQWQWAWETIGHYLARRRSWAPYHAAVTDPEGQRPEATAGPAADRNN
jgi:hypothetical protein